MYVVCARVVLNIYVCGCGGYSLRFCVPVMYESRRRPLDGTSVNHELLFYFLYSFFGISFFVLLLCSYRWLSRCCTETCCAMTTINANTHSIYTYYMYISRSTPSVRPSVRPPCRPMPMPMPMSIANANANANAQAPGGYKSPI